MMVGVVSIGDITWSAKLKDYRTIRAQQLEDFTSCRGRRHYSTVSLR
jgi:hypothetical protein